MFTGILLTYQLEIMELNIKYLEAHRMVARQSVRKFAYRIGVSRTWYYHAMHGRFLTTVRLKTLDSIAEKLGIPVKDLIK